MAEYMLIKFENEVDRIHAATFGNLPGGPEIIAVYRAPTVFCKCANKEGAAIKKRGWFLGRRWGWWCCDLCGAVSEVAHKNAIRSEAFGFNLLDHTIERQKD